MLEEISFFFPLKISVKRNCGLSFSSPINNDANVKIADTTRTINTYMYIHNSWSQYTLKYLKF